MYDPQQQPEIEEKPSPFAAKSMFSQSPFLGTNHNFVMGPRRVKLPEKKVQKEEEKMTFQEKLLFNLVEGLQQQREYDLKRKNEDLLERIERLEKGKDKEQKSQGFMTQDPSAS